MLGVDQAIKHAVRLMPEGEPFFRCPPFFELERVTNTGVAFSLFSSMQGIVVLLPAALMLLLLAGGLNTLVNVLDNALTVIRKQYTLIIAYVITWIFAEWSAPVMTGQAGINGAAFSFLSAMGVLLIAVTVLFIAGYRNAKKLRVRNTEIGD